MVDYSILRNLTMALCPRVLCPSLCPIAAFFRWCSKWFQGNKMQTVAGGSCCSAFLYTVCFLYSRCVCEKNHVHSSSARLLMVDNQTATKWGGRASKRLWNVELMPLVIPGNACRAFISFITSVHTVCKRQREKIERNSDRETEGKGHGRIWMRNP